jgi:GntR family transcriptional regulator / MocR family aminotransferase
MSATAAEELHIALDASSPEPMRRQLVRALREAIRAQRLRTGVRLPASRVLAEQLHVSRGVVTDAYEQLAAEGWVRSRPGAGTTVAAAGVVSGPEPEPPPARPRVRYDFVPFTPDVSLFPRRLWARAVSRAAIEAPDDELGYQAGHGSAALREALASYLGRVRGTSVHPNAIVICGGYTQATALLFGVLARRGVRRVALEDPSSPDHCWEMAERTGLEAIPVPLDAEGLRVDALSASGAEAVVVTPNHQFPSGAVMGPQRRRELLGWARAGDRLVIEDDYDAEFRYDRRPLAALQGLDPGHVVYVGTASKTLAPSLRLGWMLAPPALAPLLANEKALHDSGSPVLPQLALAQLVATGELDRHLRSVRATYSRRRDELVAALTETVPQGHVEGAAAGLHLVLALPVALDRDRLDAALHGHSVRAVVIEHRDPARAPEGTRLALGYGRLPVAAIRAAVTALADALREAGLHEAGLQGRAAAAASGSLTT